MGVCCPKAVYFGLSEVPEAVACGMLQITLPPVGVLPQVLEDEKANEIAAELQNKLLAYRLANFAKIRISQLQGTSFTAQTYELAANLAA